MAIYSLKVEKHVLGGLLKHSQVFAEVENFLTEKDFFHDVHYTIFTMLRDSYLKGEKVDKVLLGERIKNLGIKFKDDLDISDYIEGISFTQITPKLTIESIKELIKIRIRRELAETGQRIASYADSCGDLSLDEIITSSDKIYNEKISTYEKTNQPQKLFQGLEELIIERGNNPIEELGYITPYPLFNKYYGAIRPGGIYAWVSRPKMGKSTVLNDMAAKMVSLNPGLSVLILDTEMYTKDIRYRLASAITGIPVHFLETGKYRKNKAFYQKFEENRSKLREQKNVYHLQVAGVPTEEILSIIRRWFFKHVGRNGKGMVIYDYIKLTGEKDGNKAEYQLIGDKINSLKEICGELEVPCLTACQLNRSAELGVDDSSAIAQCDRLMWYANFVAISRKKNLKELDEYGMDFGSHLWKPLASRFQGEEAMGYFDKIKMPLENGKYQYTDFFLNFNIENFNVEEKGSILDIIKAKTLRPDINKKKKQELL